MIPPAIPSAGDLEAEPGDGSRGGLECFSLGFVGEPVFVTRPGISGEDEGRLLTLAYGGDRHRPDVGILDAQALGRGPVARLHLKHHVPYGLHGGFTPETFLDSATVAT